MIPLSNHDSSESEVVIIYPGECKRQTIPRFKYAQIKKKMNPIPLFYSTPKPETMV